MFQIICWKIHNCPLIIQFLGSSWIGKGQQNIIVVNSTLYEIYIIIILKNHASHKLHLSSIIESHHVAPHSNLIVLMLHLQILIELPYQ